MRASDRSTKVLLLACAAGYLFGCAVGGAESGVPLNWTDDRAKYPEVWAAIATHQIDVLPSPSPAWTVEVHVAEQDVGLPHEVVFVDSTDSGSCGNDMNIYYHGTKGWLAIGAFCGLDMRVLDSRTAGVNDVLLIGPDGPGAPSKWDGHSWGRTIRCTQKSPILCYDPR